MSNNSSLPVRPFPEDGAQQIWTVSELNRRARQMLEQTFATVWVEGEVSNLSKPSSGHIYFTLKDAGAQIRCAMFRQHATSQMSMIKEGGHITAVAKVSLYEGRGDYQLIVHRAIASGEGLLKQRFEELKQRLLQEGLFDTSTKKELPKYPQKIALITSPSGAVIRDMISVFKRRAPWINLVLLPTAVQGDEATQTLVKSINMADQQGYDALVVARGGGSLEDLWCFNTEAVARAIHRCQTPTVSAVGHETDVSISDFVADVRAPTPSVAAEMLSPQSEQLMQDYDAYAQRLTHMLQQQLVHAQLKVQALQSKLRHPGDYLRQQTQRLDDWELRLQLSLTHRLKTTNQVFSNLKQQLIGYGPHKIIPILKKQQLFLHHRLTAMGKKTLKQPQEQHLALLHRLQIVSPLATLTRGYAVVTNRHDKVITKASNVPLGTRINIKLSDGDLKARVEDNHVAPITLSIFDTE